jgi:hypothetical protein
MLFIKSEAYLTPLNDEEETLLRAVKTDKQMNNTSFFHFKNK